MIEETYTKKEAEQLGIIGADGLGFVNPKSAFKKVNKKILELIEGGNLVFRKPWRDGYRVKGVTYGAQNYETQHPYRGYNAWLISFINISLNKDYQYFLTAKQIKERGGKLKKDAVEFPVHAFIKGEKEKTSKKTGETITETYTGWVDYVVFPIEHVEGLKPIKRREQKETPVEVIVDAETIVSNMPRKPEIKHGGDSAHYSPSSDHVQMPSKKAFKNIRQYYSVLFHELIHSTGHKKRLSRELGNPFGSKKYAFEELIAELGAAYLCGVTEIDYYTVNNSAAYLKGWSKKLATEIKEDPSFLFRAVYAAAKAAKFIIGETLNKKATKGGQYALFGNEDKKDTGVFFINEYIKLHNTIVTYEQAEVLLEKLQNAIQTKEIGKAHPYAKYIARVQDNLIKLCKYSATHGDIQVIINHFALKKYKEIVGGGLNGFMIPFIAAAAGKLIEIAVEKKFDPNHGVHGVKSAKGSKKSVKKALNGIDVPGFIRADHKPTEKPQGVFRLPGEIGKFLQDLQFYKGMIVLTGDPHAGKTELAYQICNSFAEKGEDIAVFSLEQGGLESKDTLAAIERNVSPSNKKKLHICDEAIKGLASVKDAAKHFRVIMIDSYQKLNAPSTMLDSLRHEHPDVFFVVIFQQNGEGGTRGGVSADYDTPIKIKVHKVDSTTFKHNYAELVKNRGNSLNVKYMVADKKTVPVVIPTKK